MWVLLRRRHRRHIEISMPNGAESVNGFDVSHQARRLIATVPKSMSVKP